MDDPKFSYQLLLPVIVNLSRYLQVGVPASCPEERDSLWSMLAAHMVELAARKHLNYHTSALQQIALLTPIYLCTHQHKWKRNWAVHYMAQSRKQQHHEQTNSNLFVQV